VTRLQASARVLELAREVGAGALELRDPTDRTALERATEILAKLGIWLESSETPHPACPHCHGVGLVIRSGRLTRCSCDKGVSSK